MAAIITRETNAAVTDAAGITNNNAPLTNTQLDQNFINLNNELAQKLPLSGGTITGDVQLSGETADGVLYLDGTKTIQAGANLKFNGTGGLFVGTTGSVRGSVRLAGNTSGYVELQAPTSSTNITFTLPGSDGLNGQVLSTNGTGSLVWINQSAGGGGGGVGSGSSTSRIAFTAVANQTTFSVDYAVGQIDVYMNGIKLIVGTEVTATTGNTVVLAEPAAAGDIIDVVVYSTQWNNASNNIYFNTGNVGVGNTNPAARLHVSSAATALAVGTVRIDGADGAATVNAPITLNAATDGATASGGSQFYIETRIPGGALTEKFRIDGDGNVGINNPSPTEKLDVVGNVKISGSAILSAGTANTLLFLNSNKETASASALTVFGSNLGVNNTSPQTPLDVKGVFRLTGSSSGYVGLQAATTGTNVTYTLPTSDGLNGQVLSTNGVGSLAWVNQTAGGGGGGGGGSGTSTSRTSFTATEGQTTFSLTYVIGQVDVYMNGSKLVVDNDFTATDGTTIVLATGARAGSVVEAVTYTSQWITTGSNLYYNTGNVGVGNTNPAARLHVSSAATALAIGTVRIDGADGAATVNAPVTLNSVTDGVAASGGSQFYIETRIPSGALTEKFRITGNGSVGIGTALPRATLDNAGSRTAFGKDGTNNHWFRTNDNVTEPNALGYGFSSNGTSVQTHQWITAGSERMRLDDSGNLAIGLSPGLPEGRFHVATSGTSGQFFFDSTATSGSFGLSLRSTAASGSAHPILGIAQWRSSFPGNQTVGQIRFDGITTTGSYTTFAEIYATATGANSSTGAPTSLSFRTSNGTSQAQERMVLLPSGNLGVGTTAPVNRLVVSDANAAGIEFDPVNSLIQTYNRSTLAYTAAKIYALSLDIRTGASPAANTFFLDSSGNLGLGTSSQLNTDISASRLNVAGIITAGAVSSTNGSVLLRGFYGPGATAVLGTEYSSGGMTISYAMDPSTTATGAFTSASPLSVGALNRSAITVAGDIRFFTSASQTVAVGGAIAVNQSMILGSNGRLGVGTTLPNSRLDVADVKNVAAINITQSPPTVANAFEDYVALDFKMYNEIFPGTQFTGNPAARISSYLQSSNNAYGLDFWTKTQGAEVSRKMRLNADGNLGIGTTLPEVKLDVRGTTSATIRVGSTSHGGAGDEFGNLEFYWADPDAAEVKAKIYAKNVGNVGPGGGGAADLLFATRPAFGNLDERARLNATGGFFIRRADNAFEGGELQLARANDNAFAWGIDVYGSNNTGANSLRFVNAITSTVPMMLDEDGRLYLGTSVATGGRATIAATANYGNLETGYSLVLANNAGTGSVTTPINVGVIQFGNPTLENNSIGRISVVQESAGVSTASTMRFFTNNGGGNAGVQERARITSGGAFVVNNTSGSIGSEITLFKQTAGEGSPVTRAWNNATTGNNELIEFGTEGTYTNRGGITYNRAGGLVAYNTTSDYRAKDIIGPVQDPGATIDALKVYEGVMKDATQSRPMLIAHEAQIVAPYAVSGVKDEVNEDGTPKFQQMDVSSLVPLLLAEIQSLRARVAALEA